jgi:rhodanese-related sulfurtransferase
MRRAGVSEGRPVVAYDDGDSIAAARAWWTLRYFGHDQVRVLDGGFSAWVAAGLPVTAGGPATAGGPVTADGPARPAPAGGDFTAVPGGMPVLDADGAAELARSGVLLDVRAAERYRGETEPIDPVAGHIPGALSAPVTGSMTADGRFRSPAELARPVRRSWRYRRPAGRRVLRLGRHRGARGARARPGGRARRALCRILVRLAGRSRPPGRHRTGPRLARRRGEVPPGPSAARGIPMEGRIA